MRHHVLDGLGFRAHEGVAKIVLDGHVDTTQQGLAQMRQDLLGDVLVAWAVLGAQLLDHRRRVQAHPWHRRQWKRGGAARAGNPRAPRPTCQTGLSSRSRRRASSLSLRSMRSKPFSWPRPP